MKRTGAALLILISATAISEAAERGPSDPVEQYNRGTADYRREAYPKAEEALRSSVASARPWLQGKAAYNLASSQYRQGVQAALKEPDKAQKWLEQALENYRSALRHNPRDGDAQHNYELTLKHLEALKQQEQQKQQQQSSKKPEKQESKEQAAQEEKAQSQEGEKKQAQEQPAEEKSEEKKSAAAQAGQTNDKKEDQQQAHSADSSDKKEDKAEAAARAQVGDKDKEAKELSEQQALWILDNMQREEYGARSGHTQQPAQESNVDQDW